MKNKEIITALETIQNYCSNCYDCYQCPYNATICFDQNILPEDWMLKTLKHKLLNGGDHDGN